MNIEGLERVKQVIKDDNMGLLTVQDILIVIINHLILKEIEQ